MGCQCRLLLLLLLKIVGLMFLEALRGSVVGHTVHNEWVVRLDGYIAYPRVELSHKTCL